LPPVGFDSLDWPVPVRPMTSKKDVTLGKI
jgi:hypothetical protein